MLNQDSTSVGTESELPTVHNLVQFISLGVSRGQPLAAAPAFLGGDPTIARGAPPAPGAADSPGGTPGRPCPIAVTHLDEAGYPLYIHREHIQFRLSTIKREASLS